MICSATFALFPDLIVTLITSILKGLATEEAKISNSTLSMVLTLSFNAAKHTVVQ